MKTLQIGLSLLCFQFEIRKIFSLRVQSFTKNEIKSEGPLHSIEAPVLIKDIVPLSSRQQWWRHIQTRSKNELIQVIQRGTILEQELCHALELIQASTDSQHDDPIYASSMGSSCSIDQLPVYDFCQALFDDTDVLCDFSIYTPIHETLVLSCNMAQSTLSSRAYTSIIINLGGGSTQWRFESQKNDNEDAYKASSSVTRTWLGNSFSMGWNSPHSLFADSASGTDIVASTITTPGDVLIIPSFWWFQSMANNDRANISIHSKRCGSNDLKALARHILNKGVLPTENPEIVIKQLFEFIDR